MKSAPNLTMTPQFWIDVGGTFTDCIANWPDGSSALHKVLSTGVYRGRIAEHSTQHVILDPSRSGDPPGFLEGFRLTVFSPDTRRAVAAGVVKSNDPARKMMILEHPLEWAVEPGMIYELSCGQPAPVVGIRWLKGLRINDPIGHAVIRLGTTRGTNALLQKTGAPTALVMTKGFGDLLEIGDQTRPKLFELQVRKMQSLCELVVEVEERISADGDVLRPIEIDKTRAALANAKSRGIDALAVCLVNSYRNATHEETIQQIAHELGFSHISVSSRLAPLQGLLARAETTVVDAYLSPVIGGYIAELRSHLPDAEVSLMTSTGSMVKADQYVAKDSILSGPAAGVVGCAVVSQQSGLKRIIGFDMGGTSTDVCRYDGAYERRYEMQIEDRQTDGFYRIVAPMLAIETVAAGGGSICSFDGIKPIVGPASAGADPGPACYGRGGPLSVTDVNLFLGRISPANFPFPLDLNAVHSRLDDLRARIREATGHDYTRQVLAEGYVAIANLHMAAGVRRRSIQQGHDPADYALVAFGGAGGQHACAVARELGIRRILLPLTAGVLSAHGIGMADVTKFAAKDIKKPLNRENLLNLDPWFQETADQLYASLIQSGVSKAHISPVQRLLDLRYEGQDACLTVPEPLDGDWQSAFESLHLDRYGFTLRRAIEMSTARAEVTGHTQKGPLRLPEIKKEMPLKNELTLVYFNGGQQTARIYRRETLEPGSRIDGPALMLDSTSTCLIEPGWRLTMMQDGSAMIEDSCAAQEVTDTSAQDRSAGKTCDPITLELFDRHFAQVAQQMGTTLERTALSTNVKDRRDFSCAICDVNGDLVAHAPHIPVHLGAMGMCVRCLLDDIERSGDSLALEPGAVYLTNDPYRGGSHLPDVTVITPVFEEGGRRVLFFAASRAHHAEIGGIVPGSMPPQSRNLAEEGVLIRAVRLTLSPRTDGAPSQVDDESLRRILTTGPYPSRAVEQNIADIHAQIAANHCGAQGLLTMMRTFGTTTVLAYMGHIQAAATRKMIDALGRIPNGRHEFVDYLDDGTPIAVAVTITKGGAYVDFTGTGPVHPGNLNATPAIVASAVLYCFRCLIAEDVPLNAGLLAPIRIHVPSGLLNPPESDDPRQCAAVAGGNVETSQRIVDAIFGAMKIVAASQGTMNNLSFGDDRFGYYETIAGGTGAGASFNGASGVHSHMTNTRLTDTEVMEDRFPVRVRRLAIRRGSGGSGLRSGGDGITRELEFLKPLDVSLVTQRRAMAPYGIAGGNPGKPGVNSLVRAGSKPHHSAEIMPSICHRRVQAGDVLIVETPGGGGYGIATNAIGDDPGASDGLTRE